MKKLLIIFLGMLVALMAMALFSFKTGEPLKPEVIIIKQTGYDVQIYHSNGLKESAEELLKFKAAYKLDKFKLERECILAKTLEYHYQLGFKALGEGMISGDNEWNKYYTLVKEN